MREILELEARWRSNVRLGRCRSSPTVETSGPVLGVTTLLSKRDTDGVLYPDGEEARLLTLLSVAYGRTIPAMALEAVRRASKHAVAGDKAMSAMHIALAGLGELPDPQDAARRIFIADGLLEKGFSPRDIFAALDFGPEPLDILEKDFNSSEPRVPAGNGRVSGEWVRELDEVETAAEVAVRTLPRVANVSARIATIAAAAAEVLADVLPPVAFVAPLLIPAPPGGRRTKGEIDGRSDLFYSWSSDETELKVVRQADNKEVLSATLYPDGTLRAGTKQVGRKKGDKVEVYPFVLSSSAADSERQDRPRLCPKDTPDRDGRPGPQGEKDRDYEDYMKRFVNPEMPTPRGFAYYFTNSVTGQSAMIDDCKRATGDPWEAKSTGYAEMLAKGVEPLTKSLNDKWIDQAERQLNATPGHRLHWCFAEKQAADHVAQLFGGYKKDPRLAEIKICRLYWKERMR